MLLRAFLMPRRNCWAPVVDVLVQRLDPADERELPSYATTGSAGLDLRSSETLVLKAGARALVGTGIAIALPENFEAQVRPRSGLAVKHGVTVLNAPGTIDADYRGEIKVPLINHGSDDFNIAYGDRIAQMVVAPVVQVSLKPVSSLNETVRGESGFGSSGRD